MRRVRPDCLTSTIEKQDDHLIGSDVTITHEIMTVTQFSYGSRDPFYLSLENSCEFTMTIMDEFDDSASYSHYLSLDRVNNWIDISGTKNSDYPTDAVSWPTTTKKFKVKGKVEDSAPDE